jgi:HEPN domain-containing protein
MSITENKTIVHEFLEYARGDLEVSLLAYQAKHYPQVVSWLQQANEKLAKAILIESGISNIAERKNHSHDVIKPIVQNMKSSIEEGREGIERLKNRFSVEEDALLSPEAIDKLNKFKEGVKELEHYKTIKDWLRMDEGEIMKEINELEKLIALEMYFELTEDMFVNFADELFQNLRFFKLVPSEAEKVKEMFNLKESRIEFVKYTNELSVKIFLVFKVYTVTTFFNLILFPHQSESRYPSVIKEKHNTYNEEHPIIKCYLRFYELTKQALNRMEECLNTPTFK